MRCFQTILCLLSLSRLFIFSDEREQEVHKCIPSKRFQVGGIKISDDVTKEISQILLLKLWHLRKPQINLVSL